MIYATFLNFFWAAWSLSPSLTIDKQVTLVYNTSFQFSSKDKIFSIFFCFVLILNNSGIYD